MYVIGFLFRAPSSMLVNVMTVVTTLSIINIGISELRGKHLQYSKMTGSNSSPKISSKTGMTILYLPSFAFAAASFFLFPPASYIQYDRFFLIRSSLALHFLKRLLETWFVHKFSGKMTVEAAITISLSYTTGTLTIIYAQYLSIGLPEPSIDFKYTGVVFFLVGIIGNLYHHYLLRSLRKEGEKEYKIPKGGLFGVVICPHYLFEAIQFWGFAFIAQTLFGLGFSVSTSVYLVCRSYVTRKWYVAKFEDFPSHVKAIIPYVL